MDDGLLLKVSFILALIGIATTAILADKLDLKASGISTINEAAISKTVKIKGSVESIKSSGVVQLIQLQDNTGKITVAIYKDKLKLSRGSLVEVTGQVTKYNNELQVNADTITIIN